MSLRFRTGVVGIAWVIAASVGAIGGDEPAAFEGYSQSAERIVGKMLRAMSKLSTYSDDGVFTMETGGSFNAADQAAAFVYAKSKRFCIKTEQHEIHSDGKELTVYAKAMRRYTVSPLEKDIGKQVEKYFGGWGMSLGTGSLVLSSNPRATFAKQFSNMDVVDDENIEGDACSVLEGVMKGSPMGMGETDIPATLFVRQRDFMIRRVELDLAEVMKKQFDEDSGMQSPFKEYKLVYDVRMMAVNERIDEDAFKFEAPSSAKEVDRFYSSWMQDGDTAMQFEWSGKEAPEFELQTTDGGWVSNDSVKGKVVVLDMPGRWMRGTPPGMAALDEIRGDYADKDVAVVLVHHRGKADKLTEKMDEKGWKVTVALDPDGAMAGDFFDQQFGGGVVIIAKDGIVQGRYSPMMTEETATALRGDIDTLLAGETLSGGQVMSEAQIEEAADQKSSRFSFGGTAEPLNEEHLHETWSIRTGGGSGFMFGFGSGAAPRGELWIRDQDVAKRIEADGQVTAEIELPNPSKDQFSQEQFVGGRMGSRAGVVFMKTIPGEEQQMGWRPPKEAVIVAVDESGRELWKMEFEVKNNQLPQHLTLADIDGRMGDEFVFAHQGAVWIVDERGEALVRKPILGMSKWILVEDRDHDRRAEIYVRSDRKLFRFDYRPR